MGSDYLDFWLFGSLCFTNHRDDLFLGVQTSCIFDIHVVKVCETRFLHLPKSYSYVSEVVGMAYNPFINEDIASSIKSKRCC